MLNFRKTEEFKECAPGEKYGVISPPKFNFRILCLFHISSLLLAIPHSSFTFRHANLQFYIQVHNITFEFHHPFPIRFSLGDITLGSATAHSSFNMQVLRPGQTLATFQRNILQHCCMMLRHVLNGLAKRSQHFQRNMSMFMCPRPLARNQWT